MTSSESAALPPRVIVVMETQWPRALIRAALREAGYDAVGTQSLATALRIRPTEPDRGPVRLVIVDQPALAGDREEARLAALLTRHEQPATILLARPTVRTSTRRWTRVLQRPVSVEDVVAASEAILPLARAEHRPLD
jgi:AmiR/NasT family two-component response regulator